MSGTINGTGTTTIGYAGNIVDRTGAITSPYEIVAYRAQGGSGAISGLSPDAVGGSGAETGSMTAAGQRFDSSTEFTKTNGNVLSLHSALAISAYCIRLATT